MDQSIFSTITYWIRENFFGNALLKINELFDYNLTIKENFDLFILKTYCLIKLGISNYFLFLTLNQFFLH